LRLSEGLTQKELAIKANVSFMTINLIEKEKVKPKPLTASKIARALGHNIVIGKNNIITIE
jgi:DNA-binding XRE family transcriptional regulator